MLILIKNLWRSIVEKDKNSFFCDFFQIQIAYSNDDNSATVSKLTAQANRKAISEIASGGCPGAEWPVIV